MEELNLSKSNKFLITEFVLQTIWTLVSCILFGGILNLIVDPLTLIVEIIAMIAMPFITIFNVLLEINFIVFIACIFKIFSKKDNRKILRKYNLIWSITLLSFAFTFINFDVITLGGDRTNLMIMYYIMLIVGILIYIFSSIVNSKYNKEEKITIDNAWK